MVVTKNGKVIGRLALDHSVPHTMDEINADLPDGWYAEPLATWMERNAPRMSSDAAREWYGMLTIL